MAQFQVLQPETTYTGSPIRPLAKGLPKTTQSLCPECTQLIEARILEDGGKVVMEKRCPEHGEFRDIVYSDAKLYLKMEEWTFGDNRGLANPAVTNATPLPGRLRPVQPAHQPHRPGQRRPHQPLQSDLPGLLRQCQRRRVRLRAAISRPCARCCRRCATSSPVAGRIVQFSGGEPTIYPRFLDVLRMARDMGFSHTPGGHQRHQVHRPGIRRAVQGSRPAHALPAVRWRLRRHLPPHPRRAALGTEAEVHRERAARPA